MSAVSAGKYLFGPFELDSAELILRRSGEIVPLTPKALQALILLIQNGGRVVSRREMIEELWPDAHVEESNLTVAISMARRALGESENGNHFIETVPKRGYRFVPAVKFIGNSLPQKARFEVMQITRLTHDGYIMDVAISPDARLLAFVLIENGKQSLWIQQLESGEKWTLSAPDPALCWGLKFSHDCQSLFFITTQPNTTISVLYRVSLRGGPAQKLVVNIDAGIALSPDGSQMAFVRSFPGQHRDALVLADADGSGESEIASRHHPDKFSFATACWSPDGKLIALGASRYNGVECAILGVPPSGGTPRELSRWEWKTMCAVAWSTDGAHLYFSAMALTSNSFQIWRLNYPDHQAQRVTNDPNNYEEISLAEGHQTLVTMQTDVRANLWLASVPDSGAQSGKTGELAAPPVTRRITNSRTEGFQGLAVSQGRIVFALTEHQQPDLWSVNTDGSDRRRLTTGGGFLPAFSRDGRRIAYVSAQGGTHHIWCMDADGGNKSRLTDGGGESFPSITKDGDWVVYTSQSKERNSLWKVSAQGGGAVQLTYESLCIKPVVSPDGTMIACAYRTNEADKWKIALLPNDGGAPLQFFALPNPYNQILRWTKDAKALTFLEKRDGVHNIWRQPVDAGEVTQLTTFTEDLIYNYDWLSDDNTELIVSRGLKTRDIVLIRNFE